MTFLEAMELIKNHPAGVGAKAVRPVGDKWFVFADRYKTMYGKEIIRFNLTNDASQSGNAYSPTYEDLHSEWEEYNWRKHDT